MDKSINKIDETVMKLLHYFITKQNYNPIILHGAKNEIWLENMEKDYKIVRIVSNYIHNNEQLDFDLFKTKQIRKQIKKKTCSFNINVLNIFVNLGDNVNLDSISLSNMVCLNINSMKDFTKYSNILEIYPNIDKEVSKEEGMDLFIKLSNEISKKSEQDAIANEKVFREKKPMVTTIIISINFILFILMYILGDGSRSVGTLLAFGADYAPLVKAGEYYRLLTGAFLHIGIIHLLCNMYSLYVIGPQLESFYGKVKYIIIYIGGAIIASLFANIMNADALSAGASGAIFALLGSLLYFGYHYRVYLGGVMRSQIIPVILLNLLIGFSIPNVSNAAHIGGLIGGIVLSYALGVPNKSSKADKINGTIISAILIAFLIYMNFFK